MNTVIASLAILTSAAATLVISAAVVLSANQRAPDAPVIKAEKHAKSSKSRPWQRNPRCAT